jgi:hypothetical protein
LSTQVFHRPACGSIRKSGRGQKRHGKAGRGGIKSCAQTGVRLSEISMATIKTLGQRLRWQAKLLCFIGFSSKNVGDAISSPQV